LEISDPVGKEIKIKGSLKVNNIKRLIKENLILKSVLKVSNIKRLIKEKLMLKDTLKKIKL
jgi:hypothetical protein